MNKRSYNKLFVNKNRSEGSEKIILGYQNNSTEFILKKDRETYFNIPLYTERVYLSASSFAIDGATGGTFPAVSDRIFESRKNYGNVSNNGTPTEIPDGTWFCSWLYKDPTTGISTWKDRYFNPKQLNYTLYNPEFSNGQKYILNAPPTFQTSLSSIIFDVDSSMVLEPSVLYKYFHIGENTAQEILTTFRGASAEYLLLDIQDWNSKTASIYNGTVPINITSPAPTSDLFPVVDTSQIILSSALGFDHNHDVESYIDWNKDYIPSQDFTLAFWARSSDWALCPSTQLIGNYSTEGGFGIFLDTRETYPFFIVPETTYGHVIFVNQEMQGFLDKVVVSELSSLSLRIPKLVTVDSDDCAVICSAGSNPSLYKLDHTGVLLATTPTTFSFLSSETPISLLCDDPNNTIILTTDKRVYTFDNLLFPTASAAQISPIQSVCAFAYNLETATYTLSTIPNVLDAKFIEDTKWSIETNGHLHKNGFFFASADGGMTNLQISPDQNLWVLHGTNNVSVYDPKTIAGSAPLFTFTVGTDFVHTQKYISFIKVHNKTTQTNRWVSIIYYGDTNYIYSNSLEGKALTISDLTTFINYKVARQLKQDGDTFKYGATGDFTGYERKRVFNAINPQKQILIKAALKDKLAANYTYKTFKAGISFETNTIDAYWDQYIWKHFILTHKNKTLTLYINGIKQAEINYSGRYELTFDQQPSFYIGSPLGAKLGLNREIQSITSIFNGLIGNIEMYSYSIVPTNFDMFLRGGIAAEDIVWSLPIPSVSYIEKIERMFKNKIPGNKSNFYNIKLSGTNITDTTTRALIEEQIKKIIAEVSPVSTDFVKVVWIG